MDEEDRELKNTDIKPFIKFTVSDRINSPQLDVQSFKTSYHIGNIFSDAWFHRYLRRLFKARIFRFSPEYRQTPHDQHLKRDHEKCEENFQEIEEAIVISCYWYADHKELSYFGWNLRCKRNTQRNFSKRMFYFCWYPILYTGRCILECLFHRFRGFLWKTNHMNIRWRHFYFDN